MVFADIMGFLIKFPQQTHLKYYKSIYTTNNKKITKFTYIFYYNIYWENIYKPLKAFNSLRFILNTKSY